MGKLNNQEVVSLLAKINKLDKMRLQLQNSNIGLGKRESIYPNHYEDRDINLSRDGIIDLILKIY